MASTWPQTKLSAEHIELTEYRYGTSIFRIMNREANIGISHALLMTYPEFKDSSLIMSKSMGVNMHQFLKGINQQTLQIAILFIRCCCILRKFCLQMIAISRLQAARLKLNRIFGQQEATVASLRQFWLQCQLCVLRCNLKHYSLATQREPTVVLLRQFRLQCQL